MNKRQVRSYTQEFKRSSATLAIESEQPVSTTAQELGIHVTTLHGWIHKYSTHTEHSKDVVTPVIQAELKQLKKELTKVTQERDILKKAAAYFASEMQ